MQTLEVTDDQYAAIQSLREAISEDVVGEYGFVRERDAVQFLLDNLDDDAAVSVETTVESSATDDVAASVGAAIEGETDPHALEEVSYVEDESVTDDEADRDAGADSDSTGETVDDSSDDEADAEERGDDSDAGNELESGSDSDEIGADSSGGASGDADDDDMLDEMMSLLETHDDKWGEATSADYRYSVELPDGTTEQVQTKDDVRALLFKNYR
ncbi:hypothetical protein [Natronorubrum sulfidifaciens]|uniref:Uncharacterized protein n=1 Tax=Natronorubrum sulfidifaciens JCM 14089 TaxID=1230460 RepID=L9W504_9EURY|nr:hypothetical protein [Natronorubrum sulfidifaciens]ELY43423.1 hypothetical protein C495_13596 [Natronorubrum sulfidifaciens JCM 14089]